MLAWNNRSGIAVVSKEPGDGWAFHLRFANRGDNCQRLLYDAYSQASSARFEHGESGAT
jgi:hypothetical protein